VLSASTQQSEALSSVPGELRQGDLARAFEGLAQQLVRLRRDALDRKVVGVADLDRVDARRRHERADLDGLRRGQRHALKILVCHGDEGVAVELVPNARRTDREFNLAESRTHCLLPDVTGTARIAHRFTTTLTRRGVEKCQYSLTSDPARLSVGRAP
jgi:hypothetical protein